MLSPTFVFVGLICAEGELWKDQRKFVSSFLKNLGMVKFGLKRDVLEQRIIHEVNDAVSRIQNLTSTSSVDTPHDILPVLMHCIGNVVNSLVLGKTWTSEDKTWKWLQHLQEEGTKMIGIAGPLNFLPFLRFLPTFKRTISFLLEGKRKTHELYQELIEEFQEKGGDGTGGQHMIAAYLAEMEKKATTGGAEYYTQAQFLHLLADLFGAGLDTTLTTVRWFLLFMADNQDVQVNHNAIFFLCVFSEAFPVPQQLPVLCTFGLNVSLNFSNTSIFIMSIIKHRPIGP